MIELARLAYPEYEWSKINGVLVGALWVDKQKTACYDSRIFTLDSPADWKAARQALDNENTIIYKHDGLWYAQQDKDKCETLAYDCETIEQAMIAAAKALENT